MANINVTISYDPSQPSGSQWSLLPNDNVNGTTIEVDDQGENPIGWSIQMASGQPGTIDFNGDTGITLDAPGSWPGTVPKGNTNNWSGKLNNTLEEGDDPVSYGYTVNAMYSAGNGITAVPVVWDPEVEENPPAQVMLKARRV